MAEKGGLDHRLSGDLEKGSVNKESRPPSPPQVLGDKLVDGRRLLHKIDLHVIPILSLCYLFASLDRANIGNAVLFGLSRELGLKGAQFNVALCIFSIPYILFEIPSNALLKRFKPHRLISICIFSFGLTTILQGFVTNYGGLLTTRFFLGFFETGLFPGSFYLMSMWYRREEAQKRFTFFFISSALSSAFGGLLASAIGKMDGYHGKLAWRWIFIIEGTVTCCVAILSYFFIPGFPEDVKWLAPAEREWVLSRLHGDVGESGHHAPSIKLRDLKVIFTDYKFILCAVAKLGLLTPVIGFAYCTPTIIRGWHYSVIQSQLRTVPLSLVGWIFAMTVAFASDWLKHRYCFVVGASCLAIAGFAVLMTTHSNLNAQYGGLFLAYSGALATLPMVLCWFQTNLAGHKRRSIGIAFQTSFGHLGGIIAPFLFLAKNGPHYTTGFSVCVGFVTVALLALTAYMLGMRAENRAREAGRAGIVVSTGGDGHAEDNVGDLSRSFRYLL